MVSNIEMSRGSLLAFVCALLLAVAPAMAISAEVATVPSIEAGITSKQAIHLDGALDEPAWQCPFDNGNLWDLNTVSDQLTAKLRWTFRM